MHHLSPQPLLQVSLTPMPKCRIARSQWLLHHQCDLGQQTQCKQLMQQTIKRNKGQTMQLMLQEKCDNQWPLEKYGGIYI